MCSLHQATSVCASPASATDSRTVGVASHIRPHPDFGTIEFRVCDSPHTHTEATALAGPAQTLVVRDDALIDRGELPPPPREWTVRENRWLAARYGIDARLIVEANDDGKPQRRPVRELVGELLAELSLTADLLGTQPELAAIERILDHGSGSMRQRRLVDAGATLADVVHHLADELYDDCFEQA